MIKKNFLPLEAEKIINNLDYEIADYFPEIFISDKNLSISNTKVSQLIDEKLNKRTATNIQTKRNDRREKTKSYTIRKGRKKPKSKQHIIRKKQTKKYKKFKKT